MNQTCQEQPKLQTVALSHAAFNGSDEPTHRHPHPFMQGRWVLCDGKLA